MSATSGKPDGYQVFPLEPWVQGRFARIVMAEDPYSETRVVRRGFLFCGFRETRGARR